MNSARTTLLLVLVALLGGGLLWFLSQAPAPHDAVSDPVLEPDAPAPRDPAELRDAEGGLASERGAESERRDQVARAAGSASRTVELVLPEGAPPDDSLAVVVFPVSELRALRGGRMSDRGSELGEAIARIPVPASGRVEVPVGAAGTELVTVDGRFLFLEEPKLLAEGDEPLRLRPRLGALLLGEFVTRDGNAPVGDVSLMGMDMQNPGRTSRRVQGIESVQFEFRGVNPDLTWMVQPELETAYAESRFGITLEPGEDAELTFELVRGARVEGLVVDEAGEPLAGAEVRVVSGQPWIPRAGNTETETDAEGRFVLSGLRPGELRLEAELEGRLDARTEELTVAPGDALADVRLVLSLGATIAGVVLRPDGTPAVDAEVRAELLERQEWGGFGGSRRRTAGRARTDAEGAFTLTGLKAERFTLRAEHEPQAPEDTPVAVWRAVRENVASGATGVELVLTGPVAFRGRVVDDRGEPVRAFRIVARSAEQGGPTERERFETEDGRFAFARVGPGSWSLTAEADEHAQEEPVALVLPTELEEVLVVLRRTATIAGRVLDSAGTPLAGAEVRARTGSAPANPWAGPSGPTATTDEEGRFELTELEPGAATLTASAEGWADSEPLSYELVPGTRVEDALLTVRVGGRIVGTVLTPEGDPLAGRRVTWGPNSMGFGQRGETTSGADGRFEFEHVTPGDWSVTASPSMAELGERMRDGDQETAWVEVMGQLLTESVTVVDGETVEVHLGGEPRVPVRIVGTVSRAGRAIEGAQVYAVSEGTAVFQGMKTVRTDVEGRYTLVVDRPGDYVVSARSGATGVEVVTTIGRVEEERVDLAIPLGAIEGLVEKPDGSPAEGVRLQLQREDGLGRLRWGGDQATTDAAGRYAFEALEAGRYTVRANLATWSGRADERFGTSVRGAVEVEEDRVTTGIDFDLQQAGSVEGVVEAEDGSPVEGAAVFFRDATGRLVTSVSGTNTDAAGRFRRAGLAPGDYTLSVRAAEAAASDQAAVRVASAQTTEARLVVEGGTRVLVKLEDPGGQARRARIEVFDEAGLEVGGMMTLEDMRRMFNEGASSLERRVGPLPPGRYTVRATTPDGRSSERKVRLSGRSSERTVRLELED